MTDDYVTGRTSTETERLQLQASVLAPHSAHLLRLAGITPGPRVLDVGCGAGDLSMLLADLVGPDGAVIGVGPRARPGHRRTGGHRHGGRADGQ